MVAHTLQYHVDSWSRRVAALPGGHLLRNGFRSAQTWLNYAHFQDLKHVLASTALQPLACHHPRLAYKYLVPCLVTGLSRTTRLAIISYHYTYWVTRARTDFFTLVLQGLEVWQVQLATQRFSIALAYPFESDFEGELSLVFRVDTTPLYTITFTCAPAGAIPLTERAVVLVSRIQGTKNFALIKQATKILHESTPAALLLQALVGLCQGCGIDMIIGVGTQVQLSHIKPDNHFDYTRFWQQLGAEYTAHGLFVLPLPFAEKPIHTIKAHHRARTLAKRQYKQQLRETVRNYIAQQVLLP